MSTLFKVYHSIQQYLFPALEEEFELDPLTKKQQQFVRIIELTDLEQQMEPYHWKRKGRRRKARTSMAMALIAKAVYNFGTTELLIEYLKDSKNLRRLCGWEYSGEIPSAPTFSRAFAEFAEGRLPEKIHAAMVKANYGDKLAGHVSRDSTSIAAREKPRKKKAKSQPPKKKKRGRPRKGEVREPEPPKRLDLQLERSLAENLEELPRGCDVGTKKNSKGYKISWVGYKLHLDCIDGDIPVSATLTSASLHDSQVAIPLAQMTAERVDSFYDLMDSAYDAPQIHEQSRRLGHVPLIDQNRRRGEKCEMEPAHKIRYRERSSAERVNSNLKDNHGGRTVRVRGEAKVMAHLMFGIIAITATQLFRLLE